MKRSVQIYIEGQRIELFNDEKIEVNSTIQNISDISKVFTDFSQSFSVPASPHNNAIFTHFYNNDVDGTFDYRVRHDAKIEIDLLQFRTGKIQLENAKLKNGSVESYQITFYGDVRTLKDLFGEDKLSILDYSAYQHEYSGAEVQARIEDGATDYDVRYPLISSARLWSYDDASSTDITTDSGRIAYSELFPALKVARIFDEIQNYYGVTFEGAFLQSDRFEKLYLYLKNREIPSTLTETQTVDFASTTGGSFDITDNFLEIAYYVPELLNPVGQHRITVQVTDVSTTGAVYYIDTIDGGQVVNTITGSGNNTYTNILTYNNVAGLQQILDWRVRADQELTLKVNIFYSIVSYGENGFGGIQGSVTTYSALGASQTLLPNVNLQNSVPDIKVADFFSGVLKEFNCTCYGVEDLTFQIEPLDDWYAKGGVVDITTYTDVTDIQVERIKLYKKIEFKHQESQSFLNRKFFDFFGREYGSLNQTFPYDGSDYVVDVPFENLLMQKFTNTDLQVGYCLTKEPDFKPYIPKPVLLYQYDETYCSFKFNDGTTNNIISTYVPFGQDALIDTQNYSLNWGSDNSSLLDIPITNSLYATYYFGYINNLFNQKNRLTTVKTVLPISLLTSLRLNDRLVIRDKRYIINEMKSSLTDGETTFTLINDFRPIISNTQTTDYKSSCIQVPILMSRELRAGLIQRALSVEVTSSDIGVTITPSTFTQDGIAIVCIPSNSDRVYQRITEDGLTRITEDGFIRRTEEGENVYYTLDVEYTWINGTTNTTQIIIQNP